MRPKRYYPYSALGNAIFIQHRKNEISVLAHLKLNSIRVKVGDKVDVGDLLGLCGNSGNSHSPIFTIIFKIDKLFKMQKESNVSFKKCC